MQITKIIIEPSLNFRSILECYGITEAFQNFFSAQQKFLDWPIEMLQKNTLFDEGHDVYFAV